MRRAPDRDGLMCASGGIQHGNMACPSHADPEFSVGRKGDAVRPIGHDIGPHDFQGACIEHRDRTLDAVGDTGLPDGAGARLATARRLAEDALAETRGLANRLRPARLEQIGLAAAIRDLAGRSGLPVQVDVAPDAAEAGLLDPTASAEAYRIVQEALGNAARHSGASAAQVALATSPGLLRVVVADNGRGFDPAVGHQSGLGLVGMRERAVLLGGTLRIDSAPGNGTRVVLEVPLGARPVGQP